MRQFASSGFRLWNLSREAKIIYTFFCALSLAAIASSLLLYEDLVGPTLQKGHLGRVSAYYTDAAPPTPSAPAKAEPTPTTADGPAIALPADAEAAPEVAQPTDRLLVTVPYRKLLEITHFHLFTVPVFLLILTHLFMLTALSQRSKLLWITLGWLMGTLHILAPWLVRFGGSRLSSAFPVSGGGFLISSLVLCIYPMVVMWRRPARRLRSEAPVAGAASEDAPLTD